jgi:hypothetical protein
MKLFTHPQYDFLSPDWELYRALFEGKHQKLVDDSNILWPLYIETKGGSVGPDLLRERKRRTRYLNIVEIIVSLWTSFFFREKPILTVEATELLGDAQFDIDGQGTSFITFLKMVLENYLIYGKPIVLMDSLSEGENLRPFASLINPIDLVDWDLETENQERIGLFNAARRVYQVTVGRERLTQEPKTLLLSDEYFLNNLGRFSKQTYISKPDSGDWEIYGAAIESELNEIPLIVANTDSWIKDVCQEALRHFNLRSSKDTIEHQQAYRQVFIKGVDSKDLSAISALSEFHYPILPKDADVVVVQPAPTESIKASISDALDCAFKVGLNQLRQVASTSGSVQSSETIQAEKDDRLALVESTLEEIEGIGNRMLDFYGRFTGQEFLAENAKVIFNKEVTNEDLTMFVQVYNGFQGILSRYPDIQPLIAKKVLSKLLSGEDQEEALRIIEEKAPEVPTNNLFNLGPVLSVEENEE